MAGRPKKQQPSPHEEENPFMLSNQQRAKIEEELAPLPSVVSHENGADSVAKDLVGIMFRTEESRQGEMTDLPLNQINPLSWLRTFDFLVDDMANYVAWLQQTGWFKTRHGKSSNALVGAPPIRGVSTSWYVFYCQHRNSLAGAKRQLARELAESQMQMQKTQNEEDQLMRMG